MKNIMSYLIVVFSLISFSHAQAQDCNAGDLPVKLKDLKYLDVDFTDVLGAIRKPTGCNVVKIKNWSQGQSVNQSQGTSACKASYGKTYAINPGNPQYGQEDRGHLLDNNLGYFFCMPGANKQAMCDHMVGQLSSTMDIKWDRKTAGGDGDCLCKRKGDSASAFVACPADPKPLQTGESNGCNDIKDATKDKDTNVCICIHSPKIEPKKDGDCPTEPVKKVTATVDDHDFDDCFADIQAAKEACSEKGQAAIAKCSKDAPETNKNIQEAQRVMSIGLDALIAKNANTGALDACAKMGAAGTGVIEALSLLRENCKKELSNCKKGCEDVKGYVQKDTNEMLPACKAKFQEKNKDVNPPKLWSEEHTTRFTTLADQYKKGGETAEKFCKGDVQVADGQLDGMLQDLAASVQKADICKCQLSAGSANVGATVNDKCESVMTPLTCMQNLNQPGCSFSSVGCSPGSTVAGCRNPVVATNPNGSGVAMPASGFAGPGFSSTGGGAAGKVNVSDGDFGGLYDESRPTGSATATADNGAPFGAAGNPGGSGGSGSFGGGEGAGNGKDGEGNEKGLTGFFNNAKGAVMSMFGSGGGDKSGTVKKPDMKSFKGDVNGYRPKGAVRGMANAGEVGGKNRDIWKTMNERYTDQYHTFITVESPSK